MVARLSEWRSAARDAAMDMAAEARMQRLERVARSVGVMSSVRSARWYRETRQESGARLDVRAQAAHAGM